MLESDLSAAKRFSPMKFTKSTAERAQCYSPSKRNQKSILQTGRYFCHYQNAIYMGGVDCFKKNGLGVLFMDNGACALTYYSHDNMIGHNVIFRDKSLTSMIVKTNKTKFLCYRSGPYLLSVHYNQRNMVDGLGFFVDFSEKKLYKITFYHSKIEKKQQIRDKTLLHKIFVQGDYNDILGDERQAKALKLDFGLPKGLNTIKNGDILTVGFIDKENRKTPYANGLIFKLKINENLNYFDVMLVERGYFQGEHMEKFGQKHFENSNYYIGGFKKGKFEELGVLIDPQHENWTFGAYKNGQLLDIIDSSVNRKLKTIQIVKKLHQNQDSYIQSSIKLNPPQSELKSILKSVIQYKISAQAIQDPQQISKRKRENLQSIRDDYMSRKYQSHTQEVIKEQLRRSSKQGKSPRFQQTLKTPRISDFGTNKSMMKNKSSINFNNEKQLKPPYRLDMPPIHDKKTKTPVKLKATKTLKSGEGIRESNNSQTKVDEMAKYFKDNHNTASSSHRNDYQMRNPQGDHILIQSQNSGEEETNKLHHNLSHKNFASSNYHPSYSSVAKRNYTYAFDQYLSPYPQAFHYFSPIPAHHFIESSIEKSKHISEENYLMSRQRHFKYVDGKQPKDDEKDDKYSTKKKGPEQKIKTKDTDSS